MRTFTFLIGAVLLLLAAFVTAQEELPGGVRQAGTGGPPDAALDTAVGDTAVGDTAVGDTGAGVAPEDSKQYYQMWIKILEGHYMTLFQSPEYGKTLNNVLVTMSEFSVVKNDLLEDMLSSLPVSTQTDMDDLYQEIYLMKKRLKALEKKLEA